MRATIDGLVGTSSLRCRVSIEPQAVLAVTQEQGTQVLYILREALSNVLRHAQAETVSVTLKTNEAQRIILEVEDDGIGFVERPLARTHYGIKNLLQRSRAMGGQLRIISSSDHGTRLVLEFDGGVSCLPNL
jgi:two-component system nitrate/nitrite sensor histidine kinase NarX